MIKETELDFTILMMAGGIISSTKENAIEYLTSFNSPLLGSTIYLMFATAIITFIAGMIAVRKSNERSILVYISIPLGIIFLFGVLIMLIGIIIWLPTR